MMSGYFHPTPGRPTAILADPQLPPLDNGRLLRRPPSHGLLRSTSISEEGNQRRGNIPPTPRRGEEFAACADLARALAPSAKMSTAVIPYGKTAILTVTPYSHWAYRCGSHGSSDSVETVSCCPGEGTAGWTRGMLISETPAHNLIRILAEASGSGIYRRTPASTPTMMLEICTERTETCRKHAPNITETSRQRARCATET